MTYRIGTDKGSKTESVPCRRTFRQYKSELLFDQDKSLLMLFQQITELHNAILQRRCYSLTNKKGKYMEK